MGVKLIFVLLGLSWCCKMYCFLSSSSLYYRVLFYSKFFVLGYCFIVFMPQVPCNTNKEPLIYNWLNNLYQTKNRTWISKFRTQYCFYYFLSWTWKLHLWDGFVLWPDLCQEIYIQGLSNQRQPWWSYLRAISSQVIKRRSVCVCREVLSNCKCQPREHAKLRISR